MGGVVAGILIGVLIGLLAPSLDANQETLTNESIVALVKAGLSPATIISAIKASNRRFDVSPKGLIDLKSKGVPDELIRAMVEASAPPDAVAAAVDPDAVRVFILRRDAAGALTRLRVGSAIARQRFSVGILGASTQIVIAGKNAALQFDDPRPSFVLQFMDDAGAPAPYILTRLGPSDEGNGRRIDPDLAVRFDTEQIGPREFRVTPNANLRRGEYCFYRTTDLKEGWPGQPGTFQVFDFAVVEAGRK